MGAGETKAENAKLCANGQESVVSIEAQSEAQKQQELYEQKGRDLTDREEENAKHEGEARELKDRLEVATREHRKVSEEIRELREQLELELHRVLAKERTRWKEREERIAQQLREAQGSYVPITLPVGLSEGTEQGQSEPIGGDLESEPAKTSSQQRFHHYSSSLVRELIRRSLFRSGKNSSN